MISEKLVLRFPPRVVREPIVYHLVKDHDIKVNIIEAHIKPDEAGQLIMEMQGTRKQLDAGHKYLDKMGVTIQPLAKDVRWREDRCVHCTACVSICPTSALSVDRKTMLVDFVSDRCIGCGLCIPVCMYKAMEIQFE